MKKTSILSLVLAICMIVGLLAAMPVSAADKTPVIYQTEKKTAVVGQQILLGGWEKQYNQSKTDVRETSFNYEVSDPSMVTIDGKTPKKGDFSFSEDYGSTYLVFQKPGKVTVYRKADSTQYNYKFGSTTPYYTYTYEPVYTAVEYTVNYPQAIGNTTVTVNAGEFVGGGIFPEFTVPADAPYEIEEVSFYNEMVDYYPGDKLPYFRAGATEEVCITLKPKAGYIFGFGANSDQYETWGDGLYTLRYNGKDYKTHVFRSYTDNKLQVYVPVTFKEGVIYNTTISNLDAPYHNGELDKTLTTHSDVELVSISYKMFNKSLDSVERGDNIGIEVRLRAKSGNTFLEGGKAYWQEQELWSQPLTKISATEAVYAFPWRVEALPDQIIDSVEFEVNAPIIGAKPSEMNAYSMTSGIKVVDLTWDPSPAKFEEAASYTAKVRFALDSDDRVLCDNFAENGGAYINGKRAALTTETVTSSGGAKDKFRPNYYIASLAIPSEYGASAGGEGDMPPESGIIGITYCDDIKMPEGDSATITMLADIDFMLTSNLKLQWYVTTSPYYGTGTAIPGAVGTSLEVLADEIGVYYYYCEITGVLDGVPYSSVHSGANMCKVTVIKLVKPDFEVRPLGDDSYHFTYHPSESVTFETEVLYPLPHKEVTYKWYACDEKGNITNNKVLSTKSTYTIGGIPADKELVPMYYLCVAECGRETDEAIMECMLCPEDYNSGEPAPMFKLTAADESLYDEQLGAYLYTVYTDEEEIVFETAVSGTNGKDVTYTWYECDELGNVLSAPIGNGQAQLLFGIPWEKMMIPQYYRCSATCGGVTKYVIFAAMLLPMGVEEEPYVFPFGDVPESEWYYTYVMQAIYKFYRAGIVNGTDAYGTFKPDDNVIRAEVAAILVRIMAPENRIAAPALLGGK